MYTQYYYEDKPIGEVLEDIYCRINKLENYMLGIKPKERKNSTVVLDVKLNFNTVKEQLKELSDFFEEE